VHLDLDRGLVRSTIKFAVSGAVLAGALWLTLKFGAVHLGGLSAFRDESMLVVLIVVGTIVYAGSILLLFGRKWLLSLVRT